MNLVKQVDELIRRKTATAPDDTLELHMTEATENMFIKEIMENFWTTTEGGMAGYGEMNSKSYYRGIPIIIDDKVKSGMVLLHTIPTHPS